MTTLRARWVRFLLYHGSIRKQPQRARRYAELMWGAFRELG